MVLPCWWSKWEWWRRQIPHIGSRDWGCDGSYLCGVRFVSHRMLPTTRMHCGAIIFPARKKERGALRICGSIKRKAKQLDLDGAGIVGSKW